MKWTTEQDHAIHAGGANLLVSAGAGSGKTAVLSERVVQKIANGASIERFLIVTFTNAAAAEMRARIAAKLTDLSEAAPNDRHLRTQTARINTAEICTIDAFSCALVRENFESLGIERDFSILDTADAQLLQHEALMNVLEPRYDRRDSAFTRLIELLSTSKSTLGFETTVQNLYSYIMVQVDPLHWLKNMCALYDPDSDKGAAMWRGILRHDFENGLQYAVRMYTDILASLTPDDLLCDAYTDLILQERAFLQRLQSDLDDTALCREHLRSFTMQRMPYKRGYTSPAKAGLSAVRDFVKNKILPAAYFDIDPRETKEDLTYLYPCVCELYEIICDYSAELLRLKKEQNAYEFSDIAQFALSLVADFSTGEPQKTPFAQELSKKYDEILVDEYQDTNRAQDFLFTCVSNGHNLFVVGDVKQSIYRFRLAMPEIFIDRLNSYFDYDPHEKNVSSRIYLNKNFRSRDTVCHYVNFLFSKIFSPEVGGLAYDKNEYLNAGADYAPSGHANIYLRMVRDDASAYADKTENEAQAVADFIKEKIQSGMTVTDRRDGQPYERAITYGDFAVLFRKGRGTIEKFAKVFADNGIPVITENAQPLFQNREIMLLLALLRTVDNPTNDIAVLSVLMSGIFGFSADDVARLKLQGGASRKNLYTLLLLQKEHSEKTRRFLDFVEKYRNLAVAVSCSELVLQIMQDTLFTALMASSGNFESSRLNLMKFVDLAARYDYGDTRGLTAFLRYIDRIAASDAVKSASGEAGGNAVRLMTVHKSKGLEFPFVILADTASRYNKQDLSERVLIHPFAGLGVQALNESLRCRYNTLAYDAVKTEIEMDAMSENVRVLYVALTRAKENFAAFMTFKNPEATVEKLAGQISFADQRIDPYLCKTAGCDANLLLMTALFHPSSVSLCPDLPDRHLQPADFKMDMAIVSALAPDCQVQTPVQPSPDPLLAEKLKARFSFAADRSLSMIAAKRSASELDSLSGGLEFYFTEKPDFADLSGQTGNRGGTAMHLFMQYCRYDRAVQSVQEEAARLLSENKLLQDEADLLDYVALQAFFASDLARRIMKSPRCYRECRLNAFLPVSAVESIKSDKKVLVQGIADCIFEENGALVLVDFKTDRVKDGAQLCTHYSRQLSFYKTAAEQQMNMPVKEVYLYSFHLSSALKVNI